MKPWIKNIPSKVVVVVVEEFLKRRERVWDIRSKAKAWKSNGERESRNSGFVRQKAGTHEPLAACPVAPKFPRAT